MIFVTPVLVIFTSSQKAVGPITYQIFLWTNLSTHSVAARNEGLMLRTCWIGGNIAMMIVILSMLMIVMMMMMMMVIPLLITGLLPVRMSMSSIASIDAIGARPLRILRIIFRTVASLCPRFLVPTMTITAATGWAQNPCCSRSLLPSRTRWQIAYYKLCNCIICGSENGIREGVLCTVEAATAAEV